MTRTNELIDAFISCNSLANAKRLVSHINKNQRDLDLLSEDHAGQVRNAERLIEDARNPAKIKEAMERELKARFKGMNITVI